MVLNRSAPRATVVPILVYEDVTAAIEWLCSAFGFTERLRAGAPGGVVSHAQLTVGDGAIMLGRQGAEFRPPRTGEVSQYVTVHVADVAAHSRCPARGKGPNAGNANHTRDWLTPPHFYIRNQPSNNLQTSEGS